TFVRPAPAFWPWRQPIRLGLDLQGGTHLLYGVEIDQAIDNTVDRQMQELERVLREEQIGAASVERKGRTMHLQLANKDKRPQRAKELIGRTALLEFKLVARGPEAGTIDHPGPNVQVVPGKSEKGRRTSSLLERRTLMTGDVLTDASVGQGAATEGMVVNFVLDARGTKEFGEITSA